MPLKPVAVDAALKAIQIIANEIASIKIREYKLDSITGGSAASAEVSVKVEDKEGNIISSRKSGKDSSYFSSSCD